MDARRMDGWMGARSAVPAGPSMVSASTSRQARWGYFGGDQTTYCGGQNFVSPACAHAHAVIPSGSVADPSGVDV